jgi:hypothetical protein
VAKKGGVAKKEGGVAKKWKTVAKKLKTVAKKTDIISTSCISSQLSGMGRRPAAGFAALETFDLTLIPLAQELGRAKSGVFYCRDAPYLA